jgi:hypothetical protein
MKLLAVLALFIMAAVAPGEAAAKGVATPVVVGSDGRSIKIQPEPAVMGSGFITPKASTTSGLSPRRRTAATSRSTRSAPGGFPAIPGRFYPATRAPCFSWNRAMVSASCGRLGPPRRLVAASQHLALFRGRPTTLTMLRPGHTDNLSAALELAFDRYRTSRSAPRPAHCLRFVARWEGPQAARRPSQICVSRGGAYVRGRLYPAGPALWRLALDVF